MLLHLPTPIYIHQLFNMWLISLKHYKNIGVNGYTGFLYFHTCLEMYIKGCNAITPHSLPLVFSTQTKKSMNFFTLILQVYVRRITKTICHQVSKTVILFSAKFIEVNFGTLITDGFFH